MLRKVRLEILKVTLVEIRWDPTITCAAARLQPLKLGGALQLSLTKGFRMGLPKLELNLLLLNSIVNFFAFQESHERIQHVT